MVVFSNMTLGVPALLLHLLSAFFVVLWAMVPCPNCGLAWAREANPLLTDRCPHCGFDPRPCTPVLVERGSDPYRG